MGLNTHFSFFSLEIVKCYGHAVTADRERERERERESERERERERENNF